MGIDLSEDPVKEKINKELKIEGRRKIEEREKSGGNLIKKITNEFVNPESKLRSYLKPDLSNYPNSAKKTMETIGNLDVESVEIVRTPLNSALTKFINLISLNKLDEATKEAGYDKLFHLQLVLNVKDPKGHLKKVVIQKTERVQVDSHLYGVGKDTEYLNVPIHGKKFTANQMLEKTRKTMGDNLFFGYEAFDNNCQIFVMNLLKSQSLYGLKERKFLYQDPKEIVKKIPSLSRKILKFTTDAGNVFSKLLGFGGKKKNKKVVVMPKADYIKEHKKLIKILDDAGKEGKKQKKELLSKTGGKDFSKMTQQELEHEIVKTLIEFMKHGKTRRLKGGFLNLNQIRQAFESLGNKIKNEIVNPESKLRKAVKPIEDVGNKIANEFTNPNSKLRVLVKPIEKSFQKFGKDTKEAFEDIGRKIKNEFTNSNSDLSKAFKPLTDTVGNKEWWKKTLTSPETYILLITIALDVGAMAGVPGAGLASTATKLLVDIAQGRQVSVADLTNLALSLIPTPKIPGSKGIFDAVKNQLIGSNAMSAAQRAQLIGRNVVQAVDALAGDVKVGLGHDDGYELHAIVVNKKNSKEDAVKIAERISKKKDLFIRETKQSYRFRNIPKTKFIPKTFRTKKLMNGDYKDIGVSLIYGKLK